MDFDDLRQSLCVEEFAPFFTWNAANGRRALPRCVFIYDDTARQGGRVILML